MVLMIAGPLLFQSTPPREGGATVVGHRDVAVAGIFQSTPPRGGRLGQYYMVPYNDKISIHAPREGGDPFFCNCPF